MTGGSSIASPEDLRNAQSQGKSWRHLIKDQPVGALDEDTGSIVNIKPGQDDPNDVEGLLVQFEYVDASGVESSRLILCERCWVAHDDVYVRGFCTAQKALRTFRTDRMRSLEEVRTKITIDDPTAYFSKFAEHEQVGKPTFGKTTLPQEDNWETDLLIGHDGEMPIELDAFIRYRDGRGLETRREIHIRALYPYEGDLAILAFCKLRQENRSFLASRILEFKDLATGEIAKDIPAYLLNAYARSPYGSTENVVSSLADDLTILLFIGRTEHGRLSHKRRQCILEYLQAQTDGKSVDDHALEKLLSKSTPTQMDFREALDHISLERCAPILTAIDHLIHVFSRKADEMQQGVIDLALKKLSGRQNHAA